MTNMNMKMKPKVKMSWILQPLAAVVASWLILASSLSAIEGADAVVLRAAADRPFAPQPQLARAEVGCTSGSWSSWFNLSGDASTRFGSSSLSTPSFSDNMTTWNSTGTREPSVLSATSLSSAGAGSSSSEPGEIPNNPLLKTEVVVLAQRVAGQEGTRRAIGEEGAGREKKTYAIETSRPSPPFISPIREERERSYQIESLGGAEQVRSRGLLEWPTEAASWSAHAGSSPLRQFREQKERQCFLAQASQQHDGDS
ncbi:unnamed protein product, partial [Amoebophrya sp. A25]|eukprot:GSA25T00014904001.1